MLFFSFIPSPLLHRPNYTSATGQGQTEFSALRHSPRSLKDIDSSDLRVTALPPAGVHHASCSICFSVQLISLGSVQQAISTEAKH